MATTATDSAARMVVDPCPWTLASRFWRHLAALLISSLLVLPPTGKAEERACDETGGSHCVVEHGWVQGPTGPMWTAFLRV